MSELDLLEEAKHLSVAQRLDLIDQLIDSVETEVGASLSPEQESELNRRYQAYLANPDEGESWEVVRERIQRSLDAARHDRPA